MRAEFVVKIKCHRNVALLSRKVVAEALGLRTVPVSIYLKVAEIIMIGFTPEHSAVGVKLPLPGLALRYRKEYRRRLV